MSDAAALIYASNQAMPFSYRKPPRSHHLLTYTAYMIENRIHGRKLPPFSKLEALQMNDGHPVLFAIDKDSRSYSFMEKSGKNRSGWEALDLIRTPRLKMLHHFKIPLVLCIHLTSVRVH